DLMGNWGAKQVQDSIDYEIGDITAYCLGWLDDIPELATYKELERRNPAAFDDHRRYVSSEDLTVGGKIPSAGGSARAVGVTEFEFTPSQTYLWILSTSDCGDKKPWLEVYDSQHSSLRRSRTGGEGNNVVMSIHLHAGETYYIMATFVDAAIGDNANGSYTLLVSLPDVFPASGGTGYVNNATVYYSFTPSAGGVWEGRISGGEGTKPYITIYSYEPNDVLHLVAGAAPEDPNEADYISVSLEAGKQYIIMASYVIPGESSFSFTIQQ
ncbi:MAG: transposase, partial [Coriobacteriia bacterium]|nr:transposase [Coriobacteriia bacterium]